MGSAALIGGALLSGCGGKEETRAASPLAETKPSPTLTPEARPTPSVESSPTSQPSPSPEPTPTPEICLPASIITADFLRAAFAGIGGEETVANGEEEVSLVSFGQDYASASWGEKIDFNNLSQDPIASLKYLVALGAYQGKEGVFTPGREGEEVIFPQLADLSLARLTLEKVPSFSQAEGQEGAEWVSPRGLTLRPETQMTIIGLLEETKPAAEVTIDKEAPGGELNYALVAFTDYLRADEETNIPRHYLALIPTHFPADPNNKNTLTLVNLLEANGYEYLPKEKQVALVDAQTSKQIILELNRVEGEELVEQVKKETGIYFVDKINDELIKNPVVPYPEEMPKTWEIAPQKDENGNFFLLLSSQDEKGEMIPSAKAAYNQETGEWGWEKIEGNEIKESDFVGVEEADLSQIEEHYLATREVILEEDKTKGRPAIETGELLLPLPVDPKFVKEAAFLPFYQNSLRSLLELFPQTMWPENLEEIPNKDKEVKLGCWGLDLKPGAIVVAPFSGEMSWRLCEVSNQELLQEWYEAGYLGKDKPEDFYPGWKCYMFFFRTHLPSGRVLDLTFYPGEVRVLLPEETMNEEGIFPLREMAVGTPVFEYLGTPGRETSPQVIKWRKYYNPDEAQLAKGFIKREVDAGLLVEACMDFIEDPQSTSSSFYGEVGILKNKEGKGVFILPSKT